MGDVLLVAMILLPPVLTFLLRSNGALAFLSVCAGYVTYSMAGSDIHNLLAKVENLKHTDINLILLGAPLVLSIFFTMRSTVGKQRTLQTIAGLAAGALFALAAAPLLGDLTNIDINSSKVWQGLQKSQSPLVGISALYCLIVIWFFTKPPSKKHKSI
ncbi:hypothetical protein KW789_02580 [Candidatus Saccharibacteria bacterium]|nr:hypothetical protein [Candidatus Saccharibacteria bacterium]